MSPQKLEKSTETLLANRYRLIELVGVGGYGEVWRAEELLAGQHDRVLRHVAIKRLLRAIDRRRFEAEVASLCRLSHPNIVTVYQHGDQDGTPWVAMEFVEGQPLTQAAVGLDIAGKLKLLISLCDALQHAHEAGVAHRDLTPQNVLVDEQEGVKVVDFGLSWSMANQEVASCRVGTPGYLAPELIDNLNDKDPNADHRVDIYSLGATIHATFAGTSPFRAQNHQATINQQVRGIWTPSSDVPPLLVPLIERCLSKEPRERPQSAGFVGDQLRELLARLASTSSETRSLPNPDSRIDLLSQRWTERDNYIGRRGQEGLKMRICSSWSGETSEVPTGLFIEREAQGRRRPAWDALNSLPWDSTFHVLDGRVVERRSDGARFVEADFRTHVVISPSLPWSVSAVARTVGLRNGPCATRHWASMRRDEPPSKPLVIGNLAHNLLELIMETPSPSARCESEIDQVLSKGRWSLLACGMNDEHLSSLHQELREHVRPLVEWSREAVKGRRAEVAYLSGRYGLSGRMDLAIEREDGLEIVDLKTGRHISDEHKTQVNAYAAMAAGEQPVKSSLWYSKSGQRIELSAPDAEAIARIVDARNALVLARYHYADRQIPADIISWNEDPGRCLDSPCKFLRRPCGEQTQILGSQRGYLPINQTSAAKELPRQWRELGADKLDLTRLWYWHFFDLLEREQLAAQQKEGVSLRPETLNGRLESGAAAIIISAKRMRLQTRKLILELDRLCLLQVSDSVILHARGALQGEMLRGRVSELKDKEITLLLDHADIPRDVSSLQGWVLEQASGRSSQLCAHLGIWRAIRDPQPSLLDVLLSPESDTYPGEDAPSNDDDHQDNNALQSTENLSADIHLNLEQQRALKLISSDEPPRLLRIQGPPGTGKTTLISAAIRERVSRGDKILVVALTNAAVDHLVTKIVEQGHSDILRRGSVKTTPVETLQTLKDNGLIPEHVYTRELAQQVSSLGQLRDKLGSCSVVAMTAHAAISSDEMAALKLIRDSNGSPPFDYVFIDEASQLIEPLAAGVLLLGKRGVLIGDEQQLSPVVVADRATSRHLPEPPPERLQELGVAGLDRSLFERLAGRVPTVVLLEQYRMAAEIAAPPSRWFYHDNLRALPNIASQRLALPDLETAPLSAEMRSRLDPKHPLVIVSQPPPPPHTPHGLHPEEAIAVADTAAKLLKLKPESAAAHSWLGIISPFRAQCRAIRHALSNELGELADSIEVDTVERFQGREKEVMLVSLTSESAGTFVLQPQRLNVTLTRARSKLILFGPPSISDELSRRFGSPLI